MGTRSAMARTSGVGGSDAARRRVGVASEIDSGRKPVPIHSPPRVARAGSGNSKPTPSGGERRAREQATPRRDRLQTVRSRRKDGVRERAAGGAGGWRRPGLRERAASGAGGWRRAGLRARRLGASRRRRGLARAAGADRGGVLRGGLGRGARLAPARPGGAPLARDARRGGPLAARRRVRRGGRSERDRRLGLAHAALPRRRAPGPRARRGA